MFSILLILIFFLYQICIYIFPEGSGPLPYKMYRDFQKIYFTSMTNQQAIPLIDDEQGFPKPVAKVPELFGRGFMGAGKSRKSTRDLQSVPEPPSTGYIPGFTYTVKIR
eukprot:SAG11_NODE_598_length_8269_cov_17.002448_2_plen_109_part_00